jgi:hypothetical protein
MMHKLGHTPYIEKQIVKLVIASFATNTMFKAKYMCVESQNDPALHKHVVQSFDVVLGEALFIRIHLYSTPIVKNYLPI